MNRLSVVIISILISLMLHLGLGAGLSQFGNFFSDSWIKKKPTLVELIELPKDFETHQKKIQEIQRQQLYVRQAEVPEKEQTEIDLNARFFSERKQRVLLETQAQNTGMTANRSNKSSQTRSAEDRASEAEAKRQLKQKLLKLSEIGEITAQSLQPETRSPGFASRIDFSTVGERLPNDIKSADMTALNTDAYLYYSFYNRLEEIIRPKWVRHTHEAIETNKVSARKFALKNELSCAYEFVLDKEGRFLRAVALTLSGFEGFDLAPVLAFREAGRIPNPPKDLIREDGTVRLPIQLSALLNPLVASGK